MKNNLIPFSPKNEEAKPKREVTNVQLRRLIGARAFVILSIKEENPSYSLREITEVIGYSHMTIQRDFKRFGHLLKPEWKSVWERVKAGDAELATRIKTVTNVTVGQVATKEEAQPGVTNVTVNSTAKAS